MIGADSGRKRVDSEGGEDTEHAVGNTYETKTSKETFGIGRQYVCYSLYGGKM